MQKPKNHEYNPFFQHYINLSFSYEGDFRKALHDNTIRATCFFEAIPTQKHDFKYAENKWTIKEILMHIIDAERVFAYRAMVCSRGDNSTPLHSMPVDLFASNAVVSNRTMESLVGEFLIVRKSSALIFEHLTDVQSKFEGNGITHKITGRAIGYIMIGHIEHHINVINEKY